MLRTQELGQALNKTAHNRQLKERLPARSLGAIEFKHANISAVPMDIYDAPPLRGYVPPFNYQGDLVDAVGRLPEIASSTKPRCETWSNLWKRR